MREAYLAGCLGRMVRRLCLYLAGRTVVLFQDRSLGLADCPGRMAGPRCLCLECRRVVRHLIAVRFRGLSLGPSLCLTLTRLRLPLRLISRRGAVLNLGAIEYGCLL